MQVAFTACFTTQFAIAVDTPIQSIPGPVGDLSSSHVLLDFDSWICKLKLLSRVMATLTYSEGCYSQFRIIRSIISSHKGSTQLMMNKPCTKALAFS